MATLSCAQVHDDVLAALEPPGRAYYGVVAVLAAGVGWMMLVWLYQMKTGMGVAGINHPVGWGVYIVSFVFWVGIAHSGTLISAILHLLRARWRTAVARSAEAMTVFAVMTAGLFPLIHLGRFWVFYYILPYPSQRQLWPNFTSPLLWDVVAIGTYFTVSLVFFYVGMIPDLAAARDRCRQRLGPDHPRSRAYRALALGWTGSSRQWHHYGRSYLFFAALATPLVVSVHSVVSWDFAMSILPGWHATIFAPYFVAGAIHSGLAMVLTLLIPLRRLLRLERLITTQHFDAIARTMLVTTAIVGYAYVVEKFVSWYSGERFEQQFALWQMTGWLAWAFWLMVVCNVAAPLTFVFRRARSNLTLLFLVSLLVNLGMWLERLVIVVGSTAHDFLPHNWGTYAPTWVEVSIVAGSGAFFLLMFFLFAKVLPVVASSEVKESLCHPEAVPPGEAVRPPAAPPSTGLLAVFPRAEAFLTALDRVRAAGFTHVECYTPLRLEAVSERLGRRPSPVRLWTLIGSLTGLMAGFGLAIGTALVNELIVGGKPPVAIIPYCVIGFEFTVLFGSLANLAGLIVHAGLGRPSGAERSPGYDPRFGVDRFGLLVGCNGADREALRTLLSSGQPEEIRVIG